MNCKKCGSPLSENDQFCKNCGTAVSVQSEQDGMPQAMNNQINQQSINNPMNEQQPINNSMNQQQPINPQPYQVPQQNYNQPAWASGYNSNPNYQSSNSSGNSKYVIIGIVVAVAFIMVIAFVTLIGRKNTNNESLGFANTSSDFYKVNYKGFTFNIPDNLVYEEDGESLYIGDEAETWFVELNVMEGSFEKLKSNKSQIPLMVQRSGYTCSAATEKTFGGIEFLTMEASYSGTNFIAAFSKANSMYCIFVGVFDRDNNIDYKLLEKIAPIISSAQQTPTSYGIAPDNSFDFSIFSELAK